ncbi:MAG: hypothetical protein WCQ71_04645 [Bacilli bacterium]
MRKIKLINSIGTEYDLMSYNHFLHKPDGFGYKKDIEFVRIGNSFKAVEVETAQQTITGELVFDGYEEYTDFQAFITNLPITFCYKPNDKWFYKDGYIGVLEKSEIDRASNRLICDFDFYPTTMWYLPATTTQLEPTGVENAKIYPFSYDFTYFNDAGGEINVVNNGTTEASCVIGIYGPLVNPYWKLVVNNVTKLDGKLNAIIGDGSILTISSRDTDYSIIVRATGSSGGSFYLSYSDTSTERFIKIPIGTSKIVISDDTTNPITAYVKVYQEYETV